MSSPVKLLSACVDTLVMNLYPTDADFQIVRRKLDSELREELEHYKETAQEEEEPIPTRFVYKNEHLLMRPKGGDGFNWILTNNKITLSVNRSAKMNLLARVRCSSEYLQTDRDLGGIISNVHVFLTTIFGQHITLQVADCDLAADVADLDIGTVQDVKEHFISRAQLDDQRPGTIPEDGMIDGPEGIKRRWRRITGLPFGSRTGKISALLYDKTHEIKYVSKKVWMYDIWRSALDEQGNPLWDGESTVWRVELRFKRPALHEGDVNDPFTLESRLPGMWSYAVGQPGGGEDGLPDGWLRYVIPTNDMNRARWPVHPDWEVIQGAFQPVIPLSVESDFEREQREREELLSQVDAELQAHPMHTSHAHPARRRHVAPTASAPVRPAAPADLSLDDFVPFVRIRKRAVNMRQMAAQMVGCLVTLEAWRRPCADEGADPDLNPDLSDATHFFYKVAEDYMQETERDFALLVHKKRVVYGLETVSAASTTDAA